MKKLLFPVLILSVLLSACGAVAFAGSEYEQNLGLWEKQEISHYRYQLSILCFCPFAGQMPLTIEVSDGNAISVTTADGSEPGPNSLSYEQVDTIDKLFATLAKAEAEADDVQVTYDPTYGFPTTIAIDNIKDAIDDEISYEVTNFEALP
jgi:uncharacterized protein DUF6174